MKTAEQYWDDACAYLREELTDIGYKTWIEPLKPVQYDENTFYIRVHIPLYKNFIEEKQAQNIKRIMSKIFGRPMELYILLPDEDINAAANEEEIKEKEENLSKRGYTRENGLVPEYKFSNFVVGSSNNIAHAAAVAVAENPGQSKMYNPLFLYGGVGLGKTHLMHAIGNYVLETRPESKVLYVSCETFTNDLITAIQKQKTPEFRDKYREMDVLLIDDIQFISDKEATQTEFFHTFNTLIDAQKQIVICSDRQPSEIKSLTDRLVSRLSSGLVYDIKFPDYETRTAILIKKAEQLNISVEKEVLQHIAYTIHSNIREMEGVLNRVVAFSKVVNSPITLELADEAIKDIIKTDKPELTVAYIQQAFAEETGIKMEDFISKKKSQPLATYRMMAMYLCRKMLDESLKDIGAKFGGRDYSTVIHACKKVEEILEKDSDMQTVLTAVEKRIEKR